MPFQQRFSNVIEEVCGLDLAMARYEKTEYELIYRDLTIANAWPAGTKYSTHENTGTMFRFGIEDLRRLCTS